MPLDGKEKKSVNYFESTAGTYLWNSVGRWCCLEINQSLLNGTYLVKTKFQQTDTISQSCNCRVLTFYLSLPRSQLIIFEHILSRTLSGSLFLFDNNKTLVLAGLSWPNNEQDSAKVFLFDNYYKTLVPADLSWPYNEQDSAKVFMFDNYGIIKRSSQLTFHDLMVSGTLTKYISAIIITNTTLSWPCLSI